MRRTKRQRGLSLLEGLIASVILAMVVVAVSHAVLGGQMQTYEVVHRAQAVELAEALLDEVRRLPYDDPDGASTPGPEAGETNRNAYDNIDDYHGFSENLGTTSDMTGSAYGDAYSRFARSATVTASTKNITAFGAAIPGVDIIVTVQDDKGTTWTIQQFCPQP